MEGQTYRQIDGWRDSAASERASKLDRWTDRRKDRRKDRQTDRQLARCTNINRYIDSWF